MPRLPDPDLPQAHLSQLDSMLSRKFGKEVANYFSGRYIRLKALFIHTNDRQDRH
jgi:hypothetical protein